MEAVRCGIKRHRIEQIVRQTGGQRSCTYKIMRILIAWVTQSFVSFLLIQKYSFFRCVVNSQVIRTFKFQCIPQSWYLGADFQLFLMAPFFVYLLRRYEWKMIPITLVLIVANIIALLLSWPMDSADP